MKPPEALIIPHGFEANYTVGFARGLRQAGLGALVLCTGDTAVRLRDAGVAVGVVGEDPRGDESATTKALRRIAYYRALLANLYRFRGTPVHFTGQLRSRLLLVEALVLMPALRLLSGRFVYTAHNALPHDHRRGPLTRALYRFAYRMPHRIVAHSSAAATRLVNQLGCDPERITTAPIGLNEEVDGSGMSRASARRSLGIPEDARVALFVGKARPYKGLDLLVAAWDDVQTSGARLYARGATPSSAHRAAVLQGIANARSRDRIEWRQGAASNHELATWLEATDLVVLPYREVDQSGVVMLCLKFGVPMVGTDAGSLPKQIDEACGVIANGTSPSAIAAAVDVAFARLPEFDRAAIRAIGERQRWSAICRDLLPLYRDWG